MTSPGLLRVVRRPALFVSSAESMGNLVRICALGLMIRTFRPMLQRYTSIWKESIFADTARCPFLTILIRERKSELGNDNNWQIQECIAESVYPLDIKTLGVSAFHTVAPKHTQKYVDDFDAGSSSRWLGSEQEKVSPGGPSPNWFGGVGTLKEVLESHLTPKISFDVRNDADARLCLLRHPSLGHDGSPALGESQAPSLSRRRKIGAWSDKMHARIFKHEAEREAALGRAKRTVNYGDYTKDQQTAICSRTLLPSCYIAVVDTQSPNL